jgi:hypothetical protein
MRTFLLAAALVAQASTPIFRFETDGFWLNLHHYLYVLGRIERKMPDIKREAVAGAPADEAAGLKTLSEEDQKAWREAVAAYAAGLSAMDTVLDATLVEVTNQLKRANNDRPASALKIDPAIAAVLDRAAPIYRRGWWTRHRDSNRAWLSDMQEPVKRYGPQVLAYVTRAYQEPWEQGGYPVNVAAFSNWAGAYSTSFNLLVVASMHPGNKGIHGFEITFHEAMHQWDEEIDARLLRLSKTHGLKFNDLLSHAMIFYTTGEAVRRVVPTHTPYAELAGIWKGRMGAFKPALDAHWKPYLDGEGTLESALLALLKP